MVQDLVTDNANHVERGLGGHGIHEDVTMDANKVLRVQDAVFILERTRRVS